MKDNPYSKMLNIINQRGTNEPHLRIAKVVTARPLVIQMDDLQVDEANVYIADYLLKGHERKVSMDGENINVKFTSHLESHTINNPFTLSAKNEGKYIRTEDELEPGDLVAVYPINTGQTFIILARVVRPNG